MHLVQGLQTSLWRGCPIRNLRAHRSHAAPPERFAGLRVLHRPSAPGHPPRTLSRLLLLLVRTGALSSRPSTHALQAKLLCLSLFSFSALGKIEVIILYSVVNVLSLL